MGMKNGDRDRYRDQAQAGRAGSADHRPAAGGRRAGPGPGGRKSKLDEKVDKFVDELVAVDSNSPEFGKKVDQLTNMGRKEIAAAAGAVQPLPRPAGQGDGQRHRHRRRPGRAAPHGRGSRPVHARAICWPSRRNCSASSRSATSCAIISTAIRSAQRPHRVDPRSPRLGQGRAADGQCRDRRGARRICGRRWASWNR